MASYCVGCGILPIQWSSVHCRYSDASQHVRPLWYKLLDKELVSKGVKAQAHHLIASNPGILIFN